MDNEKLDKALKNKEMFKTCAQALADTDSIIGIYKVFGKDEHVHINISDKAFKVEVSVVHQILIKDKEKLESRIKELNKEFEEL